MVFGVVLSEGHVMPLYIFQKDLKVNTVEYLKVLEMHILPWICKVAAGKPYMFLKVLEMHVLPWIHKVAAVWQQDLAPCLTSRKTQLWLSNNFIDVVLPDIWPLNLLDLNPMDFFVWSTIERCTNKIPCKTKDELIKRIKKEFKAMKKAQIVRACLRFRGRIESVIDAKGNLIE